MACEFHSAFHLDQGFEDHYIRPHRGLGGQTPYERKKEKLTLRLTTLAGSYRPR